MAGHEIIYLVLFGICLILSAFFSSSETAIFSLQKVRLQYLVEQQVAGAGSIARMIEQPSKLLSTILLGNNLVNVATAAIATTLAIKYLPENQGVLIATICTTIILLVFSETIPKTIAAYHSEKVSLIYARPLKIISWLLYPFVIVLNWIVSLFTRLFGFGHSTGSLFSVEEIHTMISIGRQEGEVEEPEAKILHKVFDFRYRLAREVMIPRSEVIAIEIGSTVAEFLNLFVEIPRSRFPVYRDNMDGVIGIIVAKDVFIGLKKGYLREQNLIDDLVRPAYFTPENKHVNQLLNEMKYSNNQMAIVVDEYGGTDGIISLTDLIEEIVGETGDEYAAFEKSFEILDGDIFLIDGNMRIGDINDEMGLELPENEDYDTIAGFCLSILKHIPVLNEKLEFKNLLIKITEMQGLRITQVQVTREKPLSSEN